MARPLRELLVPILFFVEGAFWLGVVATGGGSLLLLAALTCMISGALLTARPSHWATRPLAGGSALFGLVLTIYQSYIASTLLGTNLSTLGVSSLATFGVFALIYLYLELQTLSLGRTAESASKKP